MQNDILIQKTGKNLVFGSALKGTLLKFWFLEVPLNGRASGNLPGGGTLSNIFARFPNAERCHALTVLRDKSAHPIGIRFAVFTQTPPDCLIDKKLCLP